MTSDNIDGELEFILLAQLLKWRRRFLFALEGVVFSLFLIQYSSYWIISFVVFSAPALRYASHWSSLYLALKTETKEGSTMTKSDRIKLRLKIFFHLGCKRCRR